MRRTVLAAATAALLIMAVAPIPVAAQSDAKIKATVDNYIAAHPLDFEGIDTLNFALRGEHIAVVVAGLDGELSANQAADLRHGVATMLLSHGQSMRVIQDQLGHRGPAMTNRYTHVMPTIPRRAIESINRRRVLRGRDRFWRRWWGGLRGSNP